MIEPGTDPSGTAGERINATLARIDLLAEFTHEKIRALRLERGDTSARPSYTSEAVAERLARLRADNDRIEIELLAERNGL